MSLRPCLTACGLALVCAGAWAQTPSPGAPPSPPPNRDAPPPIVVLQPPPPPADPPAPDGEPPRRRPHPAVVAAEAAAREAAAEAERRRAERERRERLAATPPPAARTPPPAASPDANDASDGHAVLAWSLGLAALLFAWWAWRRAHRLAREKSRLDRERRRLQTAHEQLREQSAHLQQLVVNDPLTGTLNRQAFTKELRERADLCSRIRRPLTLVVFDLDHFKAINDRHGHLVGDAALRLVAGVVRRHLDSEDLFGRFGGDEFLIACSDQAPDEVVALLDRIRRAVETEATRHEPPLPDLSLSMGVAHAADENDYVATALFARADAALYAAKRQGRNRVVVADDALPRVAADTGRHL